MKIKQIKAKEDITINEINSLIKKSNLTDSLIYDILFFSREINNDFEHLKHAQNEMAYKQFFADLKVNIKKLKERSKKYEGKVAEINCKLK